MRFNIPVEPFYPLIQGKGIQIGIDMDINIIDKNVVFAARNMPNRYRCVNTFMNRALLDPHLLFL